MKTGGDPITAILHKMGIRPEGPLFNNGVTFHMDEIRKMKTEKTKRNPELVWIMAKIRLLDEDDAYSVLESYAKEHAIEFSKFMLNEYETGRFVRQMKSADQWYDQWNQKNLSEI